MNTGENVIDPEWIRRLRTRHEHSEQKNYKRGLCVHALNGQVTENGRCPVCGNVTAERGLIER